MTNRSPTLAPSKKAHAFDPKTREYLGAVEVYLSPLEGTYPLPSGVVDLAPGDAPGLYKKYRVLPSLDAWEVVADYRNVMVYEKATAQPVRNALVLGDALPVTLTTSQPIALGPLDYKRNRWDESANTWRTIPDYSHALVWEKQTGERVEALPLGEPLPGHLTTVAPPPFKAGTTITWNEASQQWDSVTPPVEPPEPTA